MWAAEMWEQKELGLVHPCPDDEQVTIQIFVTCHPAQAYRFVIERPSEDLDGMMERFELNTGSGSLSQFWPLAVAFAEGMVKVGPISTYSNADRARNPTEPVVAPKA